MARLIKLFIPDGNKQQMSHQKYQRHIKQSQYHMPPYLELSRPISFSNI